MNFVLNSIDWIWKWNKYPQAKKKKKLFPFFLDCVNRKTIQHLKRTPHDAKFQALYSVRITLIPVWVIIVTYCEFALNTESIMLITLACRVAALTRSEGHWAARCGKCYSHSPVLQTVSLSIIWLTLKFSPTFDWLSCSHGLWASCGTTDGVIFWNFLLCLRVLLSLLLSSAVYKTLPGRRDGRRCQTVASRSSRLIYEFHLASLNTDLTRWANSPAVATLGLLPGLAQHLHHQRRFHSFVPASPPASSDVVASPGAPEEAYRVCFEKKRWDFNALRQNSVHHVFVHQSGLQSSLSCCGAVLDLTHAIFGNKHFSYF